MISMQQFSFFIKTVTGTLVLRNHTMQNYRDIYSETKSCRFVFKGLAFEFGNLKNYCYNLQAVGLQSY